jgi:MAF protein
VTPLPPPDFVVLASTSPRRQQFFSTLGLPFVVLPPGTADGQEVDETPRPAEPPAAMVQRLSMAKADSVIHGLGQRLPQAAQYTRLVVVAADTTVTLAGEILGKPATPAEATQMLRQLRDCPHQVLSSVTVARPSGEMATRLQTTTVRMRPYSEADIAQYVAGGSPLDKAGAYGIQDTEFAPVAQIEGCFASVMGFPPAEFLSALNEVGLGLPYTIAHWCETVIGQHCTCANKVH